MPLPRGTVLLAVNTKFLEPNEGIPIVVAAQEEIAKRDDACEYVDTSEATIANRVHFDVQGTLKVGQLFAEAYSMLEAVTVP